MPDDPSRPPASPGSVLRHAREQAELSQLELAARVGLSPSFVSRFEAGTRAATWPTLCRLLAVLDLQPRLAVEALDAHLDRLLDREAEHSTQAWVDQLGFDPFYLCTLLGELPLVVDGMLAARLHGLPVPIGPFEFLVAGPDAAARIDALTQTSWARLRWERDDTWVTRGDQRWITVRAVLDPPPTVRLTLPSELVDEDHVQADVVQVGSLRLTPDERRIALRAMRRIGDGA